MKTLSIVIPNYNNSKYLAKCIDSVLDQSYPLEEIVIYDDRSTDDSAAILKEYAKKDARIRLILATENKGVSVARDTAIRSCKTEYVTTIDADDFFYDKDKLLREMEKIEQSDVPACAFSQTVLADEAGNICSDMTLIDLQKDFRFRTVTQTIGVHIARDICFPLKDYIAVGGYVSDMKLFEDWDLSLKLLSRCPFIFSGGYGTVYRQKDNGLSRVDQKQIVAAKIRAFRQGGDYLEYTLSERLVFYLRTYLYAMISNIRK
ncbi:MAG: glycosyltransferase family 2 protein [Lachnospiraceae bacterium]|nr:glycosyltransferase family 2 protein [Lachnospiraceae bacterium]